MHEPFKRMTMTMTLTPNRAKVGRFIRTRSRTSHHNDSTTPTPRTANTVSQRQVNVLVWRLRQQGLDRLAVDEAMERWRQTLLKPRLTAKALDGRIRKAYAADPRIIDADVEASALDIFADLPSDPAPNV